MYEIEKEQVSDQSTGIAAIVKKEEKKQKKEMEKREEKERKARVEKTKMEEKEMRKKWTKEGYDNEGYVEVDAEIRSIISSEENSYNELLWRYGRD